MRTVSSSHAAFHLKTAKHVPSAHPPSSRDFDEEQALEPSTSLNVCSNRSPDRTTKCEFLARHDMRMSLAGDWPPLGSLRSSGRDSPPIERPPGRSRQEAS